MILNKLQKALAPDEITTWLKNVGATDICTNGWDEKRLVSSFESNEYLYLLNGNVLCSLVIYLRPTHGLREILFLATGQKDRGQGYMQKLLKFFIEAEPGGKVWLECREDNASAIKLYLSLGFVEAGRRPTYYKDGTTAILFNF